MDQQELQEEVKDSEVEETTEEETQEEVVEAAEEPSLEEKINALSENEEAEKPAEEVAEEPEVAAKEEPVYTPNYKFKHHDNTYEFDESLKEVVTNEEREAKLRELYEKAYGLDAVKPKYQEVKTKFEELNKEYTDLNSGIQNLDAMVQRGDFDQFFDSIKIPKEKIYQWVVNQVNYQQASPEEKQRMDTQLETQRQAYLNEQAFQSTQQQLEAQKETFLKREMDLVMMQPEVKQFAEAYNAKAGQPDAFYKFALERGETAWVTRQQEYSAKQAVDEALGLLKPLMGDVGQSQPTHPSATGQQAPPQSQQKPKVIPNVQGKATSPVSTPRIKSLDQLRALTASDKFND